MSLVRDTLGVSAREGELADLFRHPVRGNLEA